MDLTSAAPWTGEQFAERKSPTVTDRRDNVIEREMPGLVRQSAVEHDLEQQIAEFFLQLRHVAIGNRLGNLIGFLDGVRRDRREILRQVPGAAAVRVAQPRHDGGKAGQGGGRRGKAHQKQVARPPAAVTRCLKLRNHTHCISPAAGG